MSKLKRKCIMQLFCIIFGCAIPSLGLFAQVTIGADTPPKATLDVVGHNADGAPVGVIAPRVSLSHLNSLASVYTVDQKGVIVYIAEIDDEGIGATAKVEGAGYYYFDGLEWLRFVVPDVVVVPSEPWRIIGTGAEATQNTDKIYQNAQVTVGKDLDSEDMEATAQFQVSSNSRGFLVPRLNKVQIERIVNPAEALLVWNVDVGCFNFWKGNKWRSMCGGMGDAVIQILDADCQNGQVKGTYQVGNSVTGGEFIEITLDVIEPGSYSIEATPRDPDTNNTEGCGFFFQRSGSFSTAGKYTVQIPAIGTPLIDGILDLELTLNGTPFDPTCMKKVDVAPANAKFYFVGPCGQLATDVLKRGESSTGKKIETKIHVINSGVFSFSTNTVHGVNYSVSGLNLAAGEHTITLTANGIAPTQAGNNVVFDVKGTGWDATAALGTGNSICEVLVDIEEGFAGLIIDISSAKVIGSYPLNIETSSNPGNYIEVKAKVTQAGYWTGVATGPSGVGFDFKGEGTFAAGEVGTTVTMRLYAKGEALLPGTQKFTLVINDGTPIILTVNVAYKSMHIVGFGNGIYQPGSTSSTYSSRAILESTANFGINGTVPVLGFNIVDGGSSGGRIATYLASNNPDIIVIGYSYGPNAADATALATFVNDKKGAVLMFCESNSGVERVLGAVTGTTVTVNSSGMGGGGTTYKFLLDHELLNGPFGDLRDKYWGEDASSTSGLKTTIAGAETISTNGSGIIYKSLIWLGDGGFLAGNRTSGSGTAYPCMHDTQGRPISKAYRDGVVYNSVFYANAITYAMKYVTANKVD